MSGIDTVARGLARSGDAAARAFLAGLGANLFDLGNATPNQALRYNGTVVGLGGYWTTNYMPVITGQTVQINAPNSFDGTYGWCFYDSAKAYLSGVAGGAANTPVTVPAGAAFARTSFNSANVPTGSIRLFMGAAPAASLVRLSEVASYTSALHAQENLADNAALIGGNAYRANGTIVAGLGNTYQATDWFAVAPGEAIVQNAGNNPTGDGQYGWHFCAAPGAAVTGLGGGVAGVPVTVPAGACYARTFFNTADRPIGDFLVRRYSRSFGRLAGKKWMHFGDSISGTMGGVFQAWVQERTGLAMLYQDARGGRRMDQIFEMYQVSGAPVDRGNPSAGLSTGGVLNPALTQAGGGTPGAGGVQLNQGGSWIAAGSTLAQTLVNVDVVTVLLGTNDGGLTPTVGSLASAAADGSYYGWLKWVYEAMITAKPSLKIVPIIPPWAGVGAMNGSIAPDAMRTYFNAIGLEFVDLQRESGISALTEATSTFLQNDKVHPSTAGSWVIGRKLAGRLLAAMA